MISVARSKYRKGSIAIRFGKGLRRHVSVREARKLSSDLSSMAAEVALEQIIFGKRRPGS